MGVSRTPRTGPVMAAARYAAIPAPILAGIAEEAATRFSFDHAVYTMLINMCVDDPMAFGLTARHPSMRPVDS